MNKTCSRIMIIQDFRGFTDCHNHFGRLISQCDPCKWINTALPHVRNADGCPQVNNLFPQDNYLVWPRKNNQLMVTSRAQFKRTWQVET